MKKIILFIPLLTFYYGFPLGLLFAAEQTVPARSVVASQPAPQAARQLIQRLLPASVNDFVIELIPQDAGRDVFEIESAGGKIVLRGNNGISVASALNWYLKYYAHCSVSWRGDNLQLPRPLPVVKERVRHVSFCKFRYCFNYCTFSYSLAWWDWPEWERMIDWMALHGINAPLAVTGQEAIWQAVYRQLGLSDQQIGRFLVGPAYLPFGWMGCIDGWGGPLPSSWIVKHAELQRKILARERELGMTPVLQGFTGHVPKELTTVLPEAKLQKLPSWCQFPSTYFLDPQDPLFVRVGKMFVEEQSRQFGSDHLYASDTFIEMPPPSSDPGFLASMGRNIYESMRAADPKAVWILQGWIFFNAPDFWKPLQSRALLTSVPDDHLMVLDLYCDNTPVWPRTESFFGKPWIWSALHNFGGLVGLYGDLPKMSLELTKARNSPDRGKLEGMGLTFEGMDHNPIIQDFLTEMAWRQDVSPLEMWVAQYAGRRYGRSFPETDQAWEILRKTVYTQGKPAGSVLIDRPSPNFQPAAGNAPFQKELRQALDLMLARADELGKLETYQFDLVNLTRELLVCQGTALVTDIFQAYQRSDLQQFDASARELKRLFQDVDELLATNPHFLLGAWLESAKRWSTSTQESRLYEWNARNLITLWGPADSILHEYAARQWSGLFSGFYQKRWELFLSHLREALQSKPPVNAEKFEQEIRAWEEQWTHQREAYPAAPRGNPIVLVRQKMKSWGCESTAR